MATKTVLRPVKVKVHSNVETHILPSGAQARIVTRDSNGRFISVTPLTSVQKF